MSENTEGKATLAGRLSWHVALTSAILRVALRRLAGVSFTVSSAALTSPSFGLPLTRRC